MTLEHLIAFNLAFIAAWLSPGPALLVAIRTTFSMGRRAGIAIGFGLGLMASTWTLMALVGLEAVFRLFPLAYWLIKTLGAAYLLYVAWKIWQGSRQPLKTNVQPARQAFRQGIIINLLNPKAVLFSAAVLIVVFPRDMSLLENSIIVVNHLLLEWLFYTLLAFFMSTEAISQRYFKNKVYFDRFASLALGALSLKILFDSEAS